MVWVTACSLELAPLGPARPKQDAAGGAGGVGGSAGSAAGAAGVAGADAAAGSGGSGGSGGGTKPGPSIGSFTLGYYFLPLETDYPEPDDTFLYDMGCQAIAYVSAKYADVLASAGTGKLADGSVLNYAGACSCPTTPCYLVADAAHPWGYGVQNIALEPFRSVAVDPKEIAIGTPLYVPAFDGLMMPGDSPFLHDGCVRAHDSGSSIVGKQLHWFVALAAHQQSLAAELGLSAVIVHDGGTRCP
jgi:3D (Asp-Asp-Asp) domain-containing protein